VVDADEGPVNSYLLGGDRELDRLSKRVTAGVGEPAVRMPGAEREETKLLRMLHASSNVRGDTIIPPRRRWPVVRSGSWV
jgi:hypothetical protein